MPGVGFKYCALHYLNQWLSKDRVFCEGLAGADQAVKLKTLKAAAVFYGVARNLSERYDVDVGLPRYKPVLDILDSLHTYPFRSGSGLVRSVLGVKERISSRYGGKDVLSLATKFLWLKIKSPIIIYDNRARRAVGARSGDLAGYYSRWNKCFVAHEEEIVVACQSLPQVREYCVDTATATPDYVSRVAAKRWFRERVLDTYLWNLGYA